MGRFNLALADSDHEVSFVCNRCGSHSTFSSTFDTYNRPYSTNGTEPGSCDRCNGSGIDPLRISGAIKCRECCGTGLCPECGGDYRRDWMHLPEEEQEPVKANIEGALSYLNSYGVMLSFYRNW